MKIVPVGTRVRVKRKSWSSDLNPVGRIEAGDYGDYVVVLDGGPLLCTRDDFVVTRDQSSTPEPLRYRLPYGRWTCANGREVLFNRDYKPIVERTGDGPFQPADPEEWVKWTSQGWYYGDHNPPWRDKASRALCEGVLAGTTPTSVAT